MDCRRTLPTLGLAEVADVIVVAPATADCLARLAQGRSDDLIGVTALAARCPVVVAPAMDGGMYEHPATQANVELLRSREVHLIEPEVGRFASGLTGRGRLPETQALIGSLRRIIGLSGRLAGKHVVVTAGATREALDPVRYISNPLKRPPRPRHRPSRAGPGSKGHIGDDGPRSRRSGWRYPGRCR